MKYQEVKDYLEDMECTLAPAQVMYIAEMVHEYDRMEKEKMLTWERAVEVITNNYAVRPDSVATIRRKQELIEAKHFLTFIGSRHFHISLAKLSFLTGRTNHSTSIHSIHRFVNDYKTDKYIRENVNLVFDELGLKPQNFKELQ